MIDGKITKELLIAFFETNTTRYRATQNKICIPILNRIYKKMKTGIRFDSIKVCNGLVIDGHHRYISALLANIEMETVLSHKTSSTVEYLWTEIEFVTEEWDTEDKIKYLNELDAVFNGIALERIMEITK